MRLTGTEADLESPDYRSVKEQLIRIRTAHRRCRFLYLMARRPDGSVIFLTDAQRSDSPDYVPPGLVYDEVSDEYLVVFETRQERVVGPVKDRWGAAGDEPGAGFRARRWKASHGAGDGH